jgi:hypothetical protein
MNDDEGGTAVFLRNGEKAVVTNRNPESKGPYCLEGYRMTATGKCKEMWTFAGHWRDDTKDHRWDIVSVYSAAGDLIPIHQAFK